MNDKKQGATIVGDTGSGSIGTIADLSAIQGKPFPPRQFIPIRAKPDIEGAHGKAWRCDIKEGKKRMGIGDDQDSALVHWVVEAPWAHPIWAFYSIVLIHLRPLAGLPDPVHIYLAGATHELWVFACDPDKDLTELVKTGLPNQAWLTPKNFGSQMIYKSDEEALAKVEEAVKEIVVARTLSPDTDYQSQWVERFGNVMVKAEYR